MALPLLHLTGSPYEQGVQHGEGLRERIAHNLTVYFDRFERETKLSRAEVLRRAAAYRTAIADQNPGYHEAMRGVAEGSGFTLDEIAALNVRYEILYYQFGAIAMEEAAAGEALTMAEPDGCTAFAILPGASANGHLLLGQNWDWIPQVQGAMLRTTEPDGLETLGFTEAGIVGAKIGLNSAGLGLCINGMTTTDDDWSRLAKPFHVRAYEILRASTFEDAVAVVTERPRSCSTNFLLAQAPDRVVDIEAAPGTERLLPCEGGCLVHTNHFLDPDGMGLVEPPSERRPYSRLRRSRLSELVGGSEPVAVGDMQEHLTDHDQHPFGLCRHEDWSEPPEEHYITVASIVMDLHDRTMLVSDGPPCSNPYEGLRL